MSFPERSISIENVRGVVISGAPTMNFPLGPRVVSSTGTDSPVIHEEFNRLLQVLKKDSVVSHKNCDCTCPFCVAGNCRCVFTSDMDLYWFTRHMMCTPSKLHSKTSRNLFPPRCIPFIYFLSLLLYTNVTFLVLSCFICLDGRCSAESPAFLVALI